MAARKKVKVTKRNGGIDSLSVKKVVPKSLSPVGTRKKSDNATSYNQRVIHNVRAPDYPLGQLHKRVTVKKK